MTRSTVPNRSFADASILVVGATGVLGGHIAHELQARGARLTLTGRDPARLAALSSRLVGSAAVRADIRDNASAEKLVDVASAHGGRLDGVVIASGVVAFGELASADPISIEELFLTNALGPLWIMQRALKPLASSAGFIAAITGVVAERPLPNLAAYCASKAALSSALSALSIEASKRNINVLDARPPHTETGLATRPIEGVAPHLGRGLLPQKVAESIVRAIAGRMPTLDSTSFRADT
jgi:short-subunit dehydrogenase